MKTIYFVTGASGSGKSAILENLNNMLGNEYTLFDFDDIGVPKDANTEWRQQATEQWIRKLIQEKKKCILLGQMVIGEILACPSSAKIDTVHLCLLDVSDKERIKRLKQRDTHGVDQHTLNWAAWLRIHQEDPQWQQHVIKDNAWRGLQFDRWDKRDRWHSLGVVKTIDTTDLSIEQVAAAIKKWIEESEK